MIELLHEHRWLTVAGWAALGLWLFRCYIGSRLELHNRLEWLAMIVFGPLVWCLLALWWFDQITEGQSGKPSRPRSAPEPPQKKKSGGRELAARYGNDGVEDET